MVLRLTKEGKMNNKKQELDKDKLQEAITKSMKTIFIGAIASIEEKFGALWAHGENRPRTPEESQLYAVFTELRKEILDKGNTQVRSCKQLVDGYTVEYTGYQITLPVVRRTT